MISKMFAVYDTKAKAYITPFTRPTVGMAIRDFANLANDREHVFCINAEDYVLFEIGEWDDTEGTVKATTHEAHGTAIQYVHKVTNPRQMHLEETK